MDISEIMTGQVVSICEDEPVIAAARLMKQYNFGAVPVRDERGRLKGIVTDRDIVLREIGRREAQRGGTPLLLLHAQPEDPKPLQRPGHRRPTG